MSHWALDYLGKPWVAGAFGPAAFDCWGLLCDIYEKRRGLTLPRYAEIRRGDSKAMAQAAVIETLERWRKLDAPEDLCGVGMAQAPNDIFHVGIYLELDGGMVMHSQRCSGCIIQPLAVVMRNWQHLSFYAPDCDNQ